MLRRTQCALSYVNNCALLDLDAGHVSEASDTYFGTIIELQKYPFDGFFDAFVYMARVVEVPAVLFQSARSVRSFRGVFSS
ncbi:jg22821 [Pararge aegeria aegeria]|uniref:Jg22821 protein n=1 Tax=Pararge aegeria aegeria TaxID=348720 RepID=A0A8S4RVD5_9NEOP|nr:jg22821 [Pararge aegeria aegeria]